MYNLKLYFEDRIEKYEFYSHPGNIALEIVEETPDLIGFTICGHEETFIERKDEFYIRTREEVNDAYDTVFDIAEYIFKNDKKFYNKILENQIDTTKKEQSNTTYYNTLYFERLDGTKTEIEIARPPVDIRQKLIEEHIARIEKEL